MNLIKEIFDGKNSTDTHIQFQKFSKGEFKNRAVIKVKKSKDKYNITTTAEFANGMVRSIAQKLGDSKTKVTGAIVSTSDLTDKLNFKEKKQFQGVKRYILDSEMSGKEILSLLDNFPKSFFGLTFEAGDSKLKIKPKAPKSGKPGKKNEKIPKPDFCRLSTTDKKLGSSFVIETENFKDALINHTFVVEKIVVPEELKSSEDFAKIREESKREGKIIRDSIIDEKESTKEFPFLV